MIGKLEVLLRIEHLEQGRGRIATIIGADLVDLVHHEDRVVGFDRLQPLDDAAGHRADIGSAVTADLRLIAHAAQRHPVKLAAHGPGDGLAERGLADAGRTDKTEDRSLGGLVQLAHRQILENALLDLVEAVMILVKHFLWHFSDRA